jgi:hypothetical protein
VSQYSREGKLLKMYNVCKFNFLLNLYSLGTTKSAYSLDNRSTVLECFLFAGIMGIFHGQRRSTVFEVAYNIKRVSANKTP